MPEIQAFHGIRYDLGHVGSLSDVVAPPYDVISPELQEQLYKRHPANVVRLILNRQEPRDDEHNSRYTRAARFLKNWHSEGLLFTEPRAAIYVYHQVFPTPADPSTAAGLCAAPGSSGLAKARYSPMKKRWPDRSRTACC